ncbi:MAG: YfhO family protein, partial [Planctomycetes bacterium]|nr:YfhO family protein [Planctomycetota bacterium]
LLLGAPQILPFAEYFANSAAFGTREPTVQPSLLDWWPLLVYPSAVGAPLARMTIQNDLPAPNYEQVNTSYPGGAVLVLALIGFACLREDRRVRPFALGVLVWLVLTCDVGGLGRAWDALPWLGQTVLLSRSQTVWLFGLAVLAGLAVDRLLAARPGPLSRRAALAVLAVGGGVLAACTWKAGALLDAHIEVVDAAARSSVRARIERENLQLGLATAVAIACAAASIVVVRRRWKLALAAGLLGAIVFQNAWVAHDYNPTVEDRFVRPRTEAIEALQRVAGESAVLALTDNALPAQTNLFHRLAIPVCDDALGIRRYEELHRTVFAPFGAWRTPSTVEPEDLALFGIEHVLVAGDWVPVGTRFGDLRGPSQPVKRPLALRAGVRVEQRFVCDRAGLDTVGVFVAIARDAASEGFDLRLRLYDEVHGLFAERTWTPDEVRARPVRAKDVALAWRAFDGPQDFVGKFATLVFEARADSRGRTFTLVAEATHVDGDDAAFVWLTDRGGAPELELSVDGVKRDDTLDFDYRSRGESFATEAELGGATLQRFRDGLGPFFVVSNARECLRPAEALMATTEKGFHPYRTVVLEPGDEDTRAEFAARAALVASGAPGTRPRDATDATEPPTRVEVVSRTPTELRLRAERERPGYLVACRSWFPGWRAYVDGVERPLLIANYAFQAVRLEAGAHEIVLRYEPWSLRLGAWLAVLGLVLGTLGWRAATRTRAQ